MKVTDIVKDIDILNRILNKMNVEGFHFVKNFDKIALCIPREQTSMRTTCNDYTIGIWSSLLQVFSGHHCITIRYLLKCIDEAKKRGTNELYGVNPVDYLSINSNGLRFLKLLCSCSSYEEFILKIQIMGYNI